MLDDIPAGGRVGTLTEGLGGDVAHDRIVLLVAFEAYPWQRMESSQTFARREDRLS